MKALPARALDSSPTPLTRHGSRGRLETSTLLLILATACSDDGGKNIEPGGLDNVSATGGTGGAAPEPLDAGGSTGGSTTTGGGPSSDGTGGTSENATGGSTSTGGTVGNGSGGSAASGGSPGVGGTGGSSATAWGGSLDDSDAPSVCTVVLSAGASIQSAVSAASPGDVICLRAGEYTGSGRIVDFETSGRPGAPITLRAYPGERQQARIIGGNYSIFVDADYIEVEGLWLDGAGIQGFYVYHSDHVIARFNRVTNVGQECMRFKYSDFGAFVYNTIQTCGPKGPNGEGIYVGSGDEEGDDTHGAVIYGNDISDTHDEGIELKGSTHDCLVEANRVHDLTCRDGGGIVVTTTDFGDAGTWETGHVIRGNIVWNVSTATQYKDGNGINIRRGAHVYNNVSFGNQHYGIRIDYKNNVKGPVDVHHNTFCDNALSNVAVFNSVDVDLQSNIGSSDTGNIACNSTFFVAPSEGDYSLRPGTSAVDGAPNVGIRVDINGAARPAGNGYDFGAYELEP